MSVAKTAVATEDCRAFDWFGQKIGSLLQCGNCGARASLHDGWLSNGELRPWAPGEQAEIRKRELERGFPA